MILILTNTYILAGHSFDNSLEQIELNNQLEYFFGAIFTVECVLKIAGFGIN